MKACPAPLIPNSEHVSKKLDKLSPYYMLTFNIRAPIYVAGGDICY